MSARLRLFGFLALGVIAAASHACSGPTYVVQQYSGDVRPRDTIAVIRVNGNQSVLLDSLDGENIGVQVAEDAKLYVEVLPGKHTVGVVDGTKMGPPETAAFNAEAGKFYRPVFSPGARVYEVDPDDDRMISDVTMTEVKALPTPAPTSAPPLETAPPAAPPPPGPELDAGANAPGDAAAPTMAP